MTDVLLNVERFMEQSSDALVLDVRSPAEYDQGHLPGAVSLPLFTNEERAVVGTAYKQQSREAAIKTGLDFFGPRMRRMVEEVESLMVDRTSLAGNNPNNDQPPTNIYLYCWRGGMRSGAVAWLLGTYGFNVVRLQGGYKAFRGWVLQQFSQLYTFKILGGYTGSGKTEALHALHQKGEAVIDLEALAGHKGSTFGNLLQKPQPTQEQFENNLTTALHNFRGKTVWLEDESRRIGHLMLPGALWMQMQAAPVYFLDIPFEQRLQYILKEYGHYPPHYLIDGVQRIAKRLGPQHAKAAIGELTTGNIEACFRILLRYYDRLYDKGLHKRSQSAGQIIRIQGTTTGAANVVYLTTTASYEKT